MNWLAVLFAALGTVSTVAAFYIGILTIRVWKSNPAYYERNLQKALHGEFLTDSDVDDILARH